MLTRRLSLEGGGHEAMCQREGRASKGGGHKAVPARTLGPEGRGLGDPTLIGERNECQQERWISKGGGL